MEIPLVKREAGENPARARRCIKFPFAKCHCQKSIFYVLRREGATGDYFESEDLPDFHAYLPRRFGCLQV